MPHEMATEYIIDKGVKILVMMICNFLVLITIRRTLCSIQQGIHRIFIT